MSILWSSDGMPFEPIHIEGGELAAFDELSRRARQRLAEAVLGNGDAGADLVSLGRELHARFFQAGVGPEVAAWLRGLESIESIEVGTDFPGRVPYALFDDPQAPGAWGHRYPLAVGRRVSPLRTFGQLDQPMTLVAVDDATRQSLSATSRSALDEFVARERAILVTSRLQMEEIIDGNVPDVIWILSELAEGAWVLAGERVTPRELDDVIRHADAGNALPIVVSTGIGTSVAATEAWECFLSGATGMLPGVVSLETPASASAACDIGLSFLRSFLDDKKPIADAARAARRDAGALGLSLAVYLPPRVRVLTNGDAEMGLPSRPLPAEPYHPFRPLEREERALLFGRDDDIVRCGLLLDQANVAGVIIHGRGGVGKASLVRAGLLPFLEEENGGYLALRDREQSAARELDQPTLALRAGPDLAGSICQGLTAFAASPYRYTTPTGRIVTVDLPGILARFGNMAADAIQSADSAMVAPTRLPSASDVWAKVEESPASLATLIDDLTRELPFELLIPIEHLDDLATLASAAEYETLTSAVLEGLGRSPGRFQIVATARTEFLGQIQSLLGDGHAPTQWREAFLDEVSDEALREALIAPTLAEPLLYASETPAARYQFAFDPNAAENALTLARDSSKFGGDSAIAVVQAIGGQVFARREQFPGNTVRPRDIREIAKIGPVESLVAFALKKMPLPSAAAKSLRGLITFLHHDDGGVVTRRLVSESAIQHAGVGATTTEVLVNTAIENGPLLDVQNLLVGGDEKTYVSLSQDSLARLGARDVVEKAKKKYAKTNFLESLYVVIPLAILGMALTFFLTRRAMSRAGGGDVDEQKPERARELVQARESGVQATRFATYSGFLAQAHEAIRQGNTLRARQFLLTQTPISDKADIRGFEWFALWRSINGEDASLVGHTAPARVLAASPDGDRLASGDETGGIVLWNLKNLEDPAIARLTGLKESIASLAFSPDGQSLAAAEESANVTVWTKFPAPGKDAPEIAPSATIAVPGKGITSVAFLSPDVLVAGDIDQGVHVINIKDKKVTVTGREHDDVVIGVAARKDGKSFASLSTTEIVAWDESGKKLAEAKLPLGEASALIAVDDGFWIAGTEEKRGHRSGVVLRWDGKSKETSVAARHGDGVLSVASLGKEGIVTGGRDQVVRVTNADSGEESAKLLGHLSAVRAVAVAGNRIASLGFDNTIKIWSSGTALAPSVVPAHDAVASAAFDANEKILASAGHDGLIKFWDVGRGVKLGEMKAAGPVTRLTFAADSLTLAAAVGDEVQVWELTPEKGAIGSKLLTTLAEHKGPVTTLGFANDGKSLATGSRDGAVRIWSIPEGKVIKTIPVGESITSMSYDGRLLLVGDAVGTARLIEPELGQLILPAYQAHGGPIRDITLIQQTKLRGIASVGDDQAFKTWAADIKTKKFETIDIYRGHNQPVTALAQGKGFFATGGLDGTVKFWDYTLSDERFTLNIGHPVRTLAFAPGRAILVIGDDAGRLTFVRGVPRPSYGPAINIAEPQDEDR